MRRVLGTLLMAGLLTGCGGVEGDVEPGAAIEEFLGEQEQGQRSYACDTSADCKVGWICCYDVGHPGTLGTCISTNPS
jgi:hypothetical protein